MFRERKKIAERYSSFSLESPAVVSFCSKKITFAHACRNVTIIYELQWRIMNREWLITNHESCGRSILLNKEFLRIVNHEHMQNLANIIRIYFMTN